jgi:hypothetical protein
MSALRPRAMRSKASPPAGKANRAVAAIIDACRYCVRRKHLRKTTTIALGVGLLLESSSLRAADDP